jgi:hypothetical protein
MNDETPASGGASVLIGSVCGNEKARRVAGLNDPGADRPRLLKASWNLCACANEKAHAVVDFSRAQSLSGNSANFQHFPQGHFRFF